MEVINNKYHNSKIYTIRSHQTDKYYIGSTTQPLHKRLYSHRKDYIGFIDGKYHNVTSFSIIKYDDNYIELLEEFKCENKTQLNRREGELIRKHKHECVNKNIAGRTDKEYSDDNKEKINMNSHTYYETNKNTINNRNKVYYLKNNEMYKTYRDNYKETLRIKRTIMSVCECGLEIKQYDKLRHMESKKHLQSMNKLINQ